MTSKRSASHSRSHSRSGRPEQASRSERKEQTRQTIITETLTLVSQTSFSALSLREVARAAGIVPTAFYRHFASIDELGLTLVADAMQLIRQQLSDGREEITNSANTSTSKAAINLLHKVVQENKLECQFLVQERFGGNSTIRRALETEFQLFSKELALDLSRNSNLNHWGPKDLEDAAYLLVNLMHQAAAEMLMPHALTPSAQQQLIDRTEKQLALILLGISHWRQEDE